MYSLQPFSWVVKSISAVNSGRGNGGAAKVGAGSVASGTIASGIAARVAGAGAAAAVDVAGLLHAVAPRPAEMIITKAKRAVLINLLTCKFNQRSVLLRCREITGKYA